jgi:hypothetical protein
MIKRLLSVVLGAILALEWDRWWDKRRSRYTPNAITGRVLDSINQRIEARRSG